MANQRGGDSDFCQESRFRKLGNRAYLPKEIIEFPITT